MTIQATYLCLGENGSALFEITDYSTIHTDHTTYLCVPYFLFFFFCFFPIYLCVLYFLFFFFFYELFFSFVCLTWAKLVGQECFLVPPKQNQIFFFFFLTELEDSAFCMSVSLCQPKILCFKNYVYEVTMTDWAYSQINGSIPYSKGIALRKNNNNNNNSRTWSKCLLVSSWVGKTTMAKRKGSTKFFSIFFSQR